MSFCRASWLGAAAGRAAGGAADVSAQIEEQADKRKQRSGVKRRIRNLDRRRHRPRRYSVWQKLSIPAGQCVKRKPGGVDRRMGGGAKRCPSKLREAQAIAPTQIKTTHVWKRVALPSGTTLL